MILIRGVGENNVYSEVKVGLKITSKSVAKIKNSYLFSIPFLLVTLVANACTVYAADRMPVPYDGVSNKNKSVSTTLPQVKVSAERRETVLKRTPLAVGVLNADRFTTGGTPLPGDLNGGAPSVVASGSAQRTAGSGGIYIRGIGTSSPTYSSAVALYVDDVYIPRSIGNGLFMAFPDIERVEILRGPQGTLYGQNSSAGARKIISRDPIGNSAWVQATLGSNDARGFKGYFERELRQNLLYLSLAYARFRDDGYTHNPILGRKVDVTDTESFRGKLRLTPSENLEAVLAYDFTQDKSDSPSRVTKVSGKRVTYENRNPQIDRKIQGVSLRVADKLNTAWTFKSITAYRNINDGNYPLLQDGVSSDLFGWLLNIHQHQISQELQLLGDFDKLQLTTGALFFREGFSSFRPSWTNSVYRGTSSKVDYQSEAAYAQGHYSFTAALGVTAGIRFSHDTQKYKNLGFKSDDNLDVLAQTFSTGRLKQGVNTWTPKIGLDYRWNNNLYSYISITKGTKFGGYNPVGATLQVSKIAVDPEKVMTYEAGNKLTFGNGRYQLDTTLFYNDFDNYQATITNAVIDGQVINGSVTVNAGKARTYGLELEFSARPFQSFLANTWLTLMDAEFRDFVNPTGLPSGNYVGNKLPYSSHIIAGANLNYDLPPLKNQGLIQVNTTVRFLSQTYSDIANEEPMASQTYLDVGGKYTSPSGQWQLSLEIRNLLNRAYILDTNYNASIGLDAVNYSAPRSILGSIRYDF